MNQGEAEMALACFQTLPPLRERVRNWTEAGDHVVLVPTMGALHRGHLALVDRARAIGQRVVVSIFVNPTQFGPSEDFSRYPRDIDADLAKLAEAGADAVWMPDVSVMYPTGHATSLHVAGLTDGLCGRCRPGHFSGVATVVVKLLNQVRPGTALFGEKDFQQLQVIRRAVRDLDMDVRIEGLPTVREPDGLALSSRNRYLSEDHRRTAPKLHEALVRVAEGARGGAPVGPLLADALAGLDAAGFAMQYLSVCDAENLDPVEVVERPARVLAAGFLGTTRLIDNVAV